MNRKQFQEWLNQFPEETIIEVGVQQEPKAYQSYGDVQFEKSRDGEYEHYTLIDFRNNPFVNEEHRHYGKVFLQLGSAC